MPKHPVILITGGTGFVGSHLVEELITQGTPSELIFVTSFGPPSTVVTSLLPAKNIRPVDLTNTAACFELFSELVPDQIYHLASIASAGFSLENAQKTLEINLKIQLNVLEAMRAEAPHARMIAVGSAAEYAPSSEAIHETHPLGPTDPYGVSKVTQDMLANMYAVRHNLDIVRVRPFNHIGERQDRGFVVSDFASQIIEIERGKQDSLPVGNLDVTRDFSDVKDVVKAYVLLMERGVTNEVYNIGSGQDITINALLEKLIALSHTDIRVITDKKKKRAADTPRSVADISKLKQLGWSPQIPLDKTLARVLQWWREQ